MKLRVFRTPTTNNTSKAFVGIPDSIKLDTNIASIQLQQQEILPSPTTIAQAMIEPTMVVNPPVNAFKNVVETELAPGFSLVPTLIGDLPILLPPIQIEEVILPDGFIHLDDISDWEVFNYNSAWELADANFKMLPGEERIPREAQYDLVFQGNKFNAVWQSNAQIPEIEGLKNPITAVHVYFQRVSALVGDWEWTKWKIFDNSGPIQRRPTSFPYTGEYKIRAVPYFGTKPLGGWKEYEIKFPESEELDWTYIQLSPNSYRIKLSGIVGTEVNEVRFFEMGQLLGSRKLTPNPKGHIDEIFDLSNVSIQEFPRIKLKFYRKFKSYVAHIFTEELLLQKNYAVEPITLNVKPYEPGRYRCMISDKNNLMYSPISVLDPFNGSGWVQAVQEKKMIVKLEINRHQNGMKTSYGQYYVNITNELKPNFLEAPPFETTIQRVAGGYNFFFKDTIEFRDLVNLDSPDLDKDLSYEFRLIYSSAGVEESLRRQEEFVYIKEVPIIVNNKRGSHKYSYNAWKMEHPMNKYRNIIPLNVQKSYYDNHTRYGRSAYGIVYQDTPIAVEKTYSVETEKLGWQVLYYYSDSDDELQQFPYYRFNINVPPTSQLSIDSIHVSIDNGDTELNLGTYHPSDTIEIVDFLGYYLERKTFSKAIDFRAPITNFEIAKDPVAMSAVIPQTGFFQLPPKSPAPYVNNSGPNILPSKTTVPASPSLPAPVPSYEPVTKILQNDLSKLVNNLNKKVADNVVQGEVTYIITINYETGKPHTMNVIAKLANIPVVPAEPEDNQSLTIGNKTLVADAVAVPASIGPALMAAIDSTVDEDNSDKNSGFFGGNGFLGGLF